MTRIPTITTKMMANPILSINDLFDKMYIATDRYQKEHPYDT